MPSLPIQAERVAVLADVHGNLPALHAVLADIDARGDVGAVVVNGDVVNRGPDSVAALETLLARPDTAFTLGNHEELLQLWHARSPELPAAWFDDPFWAATAHNAEALAEAGLLDVPADWPLTQVVTHPFGGLPALVAHGTPESHREGLGVRTPDARVHELAWGYGALVGSHLHRPMLRQLQGGAWALNTGGVGVSFDGDPRAAYLLLTAVQGGGGELSGGGGWQPELVRVDYDRAKSLARFERGGYLRAGLSAQIFRQEVAEARSLYTPFWTHTEELGLPRSAETWQAFLNLQKP